MVFLRKMKVFVGQEHSRRPAWSQMESKLRLEASLKRKMEFKWRLEASLEGQMESKLRLEASLKA